MRDWVDDESGWQPLGRVEIEWMGASEGYLYIYQSHAPEAEGWAFTWGNADNHIEVCEVSTGPLGENCYSMRDTVEWGDESDHPDRDRLTRIPFIASDWILENATENGGSKDVENW
jgi:hypothetical protein